MDYFRDLAMKSPRAFKNHQSDWANFCHLSYLDHQNPPTAEMYIDFIRKIKETGRTEKSIYNIYLRLRKIALHVYGQDLQKFDNLNEIVPKHSRLNEPRLPNSSLNEINSDSYDLETHILTQKEETEESRKVLDNQETQTFVYDATEGAIAVHKEKFIQTDLQCSVCSLEVSSIENLKNHVESVHGLKLKLRVDNSLKEQPEQVHESKQKMQDNQSNIAQPLNPTEITNMTDSSDILIEPVHEENKKLEKFKADILANAKLQFKILKSKIQAKDSEEDAKTDKHGISYYC